MIKQITSTALLMAILALFGLSLAACNGAHAHASSPTVVHVKMTDFKFDMDKTTIPVGPVEFIFENDGNETHEAVLEPAGANDKPFEAGGQESEVEDVAPGASATLDWTIDQPGEYQLGCHIKENNLDHYALGMVESFTVK